MPRVGATLVGALGDHEGRPYRGIFDKGCPYGM